MQMPDINLDALPGPDRNRWDLRDEVFWSPGRSRFVVVYSISEYRMGWEVGLLCWGHMLGSATVVDYTLTRPLVACWTTSCRWITEDVFAIRGVHAVHLLRYTTPLILGHATRGFFIIPDSEAMDLGSDSGVTIDQAAIDIVHWTPWDQEGLDKALDQQDQKTPPQSPQL
jgi:hypothetical protein